MRVRILIADADRRLTEIYREHLEGLGLAVRIIMRRRPVGVSLAWLTVVFVFPLAGAAVYLTFGDRRYGVNKSGKLSVEAKKNLRAVTPGQSAVFYDRQEIIGGGTII